MTGDYDNSIVVVCLACRLKWITWRTRDLRCSCGSRSVEVQPK